MNIGMRDENLIDDVLSDADVDLLRRLDALYAGADKVAIKKLSKNDRAWAWLEPENKQVGFYVPLEFRGDFFQRIKNCRYEPTYHTFCKEKFALAGLVFGTTHI